MAWSPPTPPVKYTTNTKVAERSPLSLQHLSLLCERSPLSLLKLSLGGERIPLKPQRLPLESERGLMKLFKLLRRLSSLSSMPPRLPAGRHGADMAIGPTMLGMETEVAVHTTFAGYPGDQTGPQRKLIKYWLRGKGAARIRWHAPGGFRRCVRIIGPKVRRSSPHINIKGLCANLHKAATGKWPAEHRRD